MLRLNRLPQQKDFEKTVFFLRRHWLMFFKIIILYSVIALIPIIFYFLIGLNSSDFLQGPISRPLLILGASIYYLCIWLFFFHGFMDYYLDVWIVTNNRIINIEQRGLFSRTISELKLYRIQDVTTEIQGFFPTMCNYGNIYIQTAGEQERFFFKNIPHPYEISKKINELAEEDKKYHQADIEAMKT